MAKQIDSYDCRIFWDSEESKWKMAYKANVSDPSSNLSETKYVIVANVSVEEQAQLDAVAALAQAKVNSDEGIS